MKFETTMFVLFCTFTLALILVAALGVILAFRTIVWPCIKFLIT